MVPPPKSLPGEKSLVGVAGKGNVEKKIRAAVSLIGGFEPFALRGKTALVKPNVVSYKPSPTTTNPEVVRAMVKILYEEGVKKVYVGDMSAALYLNTISNMEKTGIRKAAEEAGAEVTAFKDHGWVEVEIPNVSVRKVIVTEWLSRVDFIVNLLLNPSQEVVSGNSLIKVNLMIKKLRLNISFITHHGKTPK